MNYLPSLDAHCHLNADFPPEQLTSVGAVLACTLIPDEAEAAVARRDPWIAWGVGCYPRSPRAHEGFDPGRYRALAEQTAVIGEIGLDTVSPVPLEVQQAHFRAMLGLAAELGRITSIHSYRATGLVIEELRRIPQPAAILHWWTGSAEETSAAAELGCCFSLHSAVVRQSKFRTRVPREQVLVETDHGYVDPPAAIPCRVEWVEHLAGQQYRLSQPEVRALCWRNLARLVERTGTLALLPEGIAATVKQVGLNRDRQDGQDGKPGAGANQPDCVHP